MYFRVDCFLLLQLATTPQQQTIHNLTLYIFYYLVYLVIDFPINTHSEARHWQRMGVAAAGARGAGSKGHSGGTVWHTGMGGPSTPISTGRDLSIRKCRYMHGRVTWWRLCRVPTTSYLLKMPTNCLSARRLSRASSLVSRVRSI